MGRFRQASVLILLALLSIAVYRSAIYIPSAHSQPISKGVIGGPGGDTPRPNERIASYRVIWYANERSGALVVRTVANQEYSMPQLGADQLHALVQLIQAEPTYFEAQGYVLYTAIKRTAG